MKINIAIADDHKLLRNGVAGLIIELGHAVVFQADNGKDFIEKLQSNTLPDIVLMDINMPLMDGFDTTLWLKKNHPDIRVLALSMYDDENSILKMLRCGAKGYLLKDSEPEELETAIESILKKGYYHSEFVTNKIIHSVSIPNEGLSRSEDVIKSLSENEKEFLKLACTDMTYREIAEKMNLSPRTIDGYRDNLFERLGIKSRVGLAIYAIKTGLVKI